MEKTSKKNNKLVGKIKKSNKSARKKAYNKNLEKKEKIDKIVNDFKMKIYDLKKEGDLIASDFIKSVKQKYIEEIKKKINN